jgi:hypothetical protein
MFREGLMCESFVISTMFVRPFPQSPSTFLWLCCPRWNSLDLVIKPANLPPVLFANIAVLSVMLVYTQGADTLRNAASDTDHAIKMAN